MIFLNLRVGENSNGSDKKQRSNFAPGENNIKNGFS